MRDIPKVRTKYPTNGWGICVSDTEFLLSLINATVDYTDLDPEDLEVLLAIKEEIK